MSKQHKLQLFLNFSLVFSPSIIISAIKLGNEGKKNGERKKLHTNGKFFYFNEALQCDERFSAIIDCSTKLWIIYNMYNFFHIVISFLIFFFLKKWNHFALQKGGKEKKKRKKLPQTKIINWSTRRMWEQHINSFPVVYPLKQRNKIIKRSFSTKNKK